MANDEYLGDGVYVSWDGYQLWLAANHHDNKVVALEPEVLFQLIQYYNRIETKPASAPKELKP